MRSNLSATGNNKEQVYQHQINAEQLVMQDHNYLLRGIWNSPIRNYSSSVLPTTWITLSSFSYVLLGVDSGSNVSLPNFMSVSNFPRSWVFCLSYRAKFSVFHSLMYAYVHISKTICMYAQRETKEREKQIFLILFQELSCRRSQKFLLTAFDETNWSLRRIQCQNVIFSL